MAPLSGQTCDELARTGLWVGDKVKFLFALFIFLVEKMFYLALIF